MKININVFSTVKTVCGFTEKEMEIKDKSSVGDVLQILFDDYSELAEMKGRLLFALNEEYCDSNRMLEDGDILAVFPPVSGG